MAGTANSTDQPTWVTIDIVCVGDEPMLCNPMSRDQLVAIAEKRPVAWPADRPVIEQADVKAELMRDTDGHYGFPRQWLQGALREAGRSVPTGKAARQMISTATSTRLRTLVRIDPVCLSFNADGERFIRFSSHSEYERDVRKGVGGNAAKPVAVAIVRPLFRNWAFRVRIQASTSIDTSRIRELFEIAGASQGLGDFRPGKGGEFGCFQVASLVKYDDPAEVPEFVLATNAMTAADNGQGKVHELAST
ncbi:MAG TPA: hypothetical protein VLE72_01785 [Candidatus Saccharimonadales bacterium]|nr:hypothetical protein [Candidatus Saccharimonadales bacterium]